MVNEARMTASVPGIVWPPLASPTPAGALAVADELDATQWLSPAQLAERQRAQLASVLAHAAASVPHYAGIDTTDLASVPVMTRAQIIAAGDRLLSRAYPAAHGPTREVVTSRTSGAPVRVRASHVVATLQAAITLRDHRWHGRDLTASLASLRYAPGAPGPDGITTRGWGPATAQLAPDAPSHLLSIIGTTTDEQLAWLARANPTYFLTYPSVLHALLRRIAATNTKLPALREIRTVGEALTPGTRGLCSEVLDVPIVDLYSAQEVGYVALQCPDERAGGQYHVQAERHVVEVLRDDGTPCAPGEVGRVVITDLHNFATPVLRYDIGDLAEVARACPCGRGLPAWARIVGRVRNMLLYPDGRTTYPVFTVACRQAARYRDIQLVQLTRDALRARVVPDGELDEAALIAALQRTLSHPFSVEIERVDEIARTPGGKLEEFICLAT